MNGLISWWARNEVAANLLMFACIIIGFLSYIAIDREVFPAAPLPRVDISVTWLGADPIQIEEQIILRIEEVLSDVDGVDKVKAQAREGFASVEVEADPEVDIDGFLNEVKNKIDGISTFPNEAFSPIVQRGIDSNRTHTIAVSGDISARELNRLARRLRDEVTRIPYGSALVDIRGGRDEEVSIEVSEAALRGFGLTFDDVARAIRGRSVNISGGTIDTETGNIPLATRGLADSQEQFEDIVIRQSSDGGLIRVRDVATVIDDFQDGNFKLQLDGSRAVLLALNAPTNLNIVEMSKSVDKWVEEKNEELNPQGITLKTINDTSDIYFSRMETVASNALLGLFLVLVVLILFLRPIVALWVSVGIAVSFVGAFIFLPMVGVSLNILSLFGFLLVIGIVVDDAIIVGESIHNQVEEGKTEIDAALAGTQFVIKPVFFAVLTSIIAFSPFLFLSGGTSELTKHISWTIIFALIFSLIESFFILPAHLSHMKKQDKASQFYKMQGFFAEGLISFAKNIYSPILAFAVKWRLATVALFIVFFLFAHSLLSQGWIKEQFFPTIEGPFLQLDVTMAEGTSFNRTLQVYDQIQNAANEMRAEYGKRDGAEIVETVFLVAFGTRVNSFVIVAETNKRGELTTEEIAENWRKKIGDIPDADDISVAFTFNDDGAPIAFNVTGDDLEDIRLALFDLQSFLRSQAGVYGVRNNLRSSNDELRITLKPGAERFGLTLAQISGQVRQAFFGEEVQRLPRGGEDVRVMVRLPKKDRSNLSTLSRLFIRTADGREVPLSAVANLDFAPSFRLIRREDGTRSATVRADLQKGYERGPIMEAFRENYQKQWEANHPNVQFKRSGQSENQDQFNRELMPLLGSVLFAIYMLLAIAFNSYLQPFLIMTAIPFGYMGALMGHAIIGVEFGLFSIFGIIAACGVVINDNLVLIDTVNRLRNDGAGAIEAIIRAGTTRFRPIILTSITTFIGLVPVMLENSIDAQFLKPTIVSMAFGILFAAFVTLLFVPALYLVGADIARLYRWAWTGKKQPAIGKGVSMEHGYTSEDPENYENDRDSLGTVHR